MNIKRFFAALCAIALVFSVQSCSDEESTGSGSQISVSVPSIALKAAANWSTVNITADGPWTSSAPDWIVVTPKEGVGNASVNIGVKSNTAFESREGEVVFKCGSATANLIVEQRFASSLRVSFAGDDFIHSYGGEAILNIVSNVAWTASVTGGARLSQTSGNGSAAIKLSADASVEKRSFLVTISSDDDALPESEKEICLNVLQSDLLTAIWSQTVQRSPSTYNLINAEGIFMTSDNGKYTMRVDVDECNKSGVISNSKYQAFYTSGMYGILVTNFQANKSFTFEMPVDGLSKGSCHVHYFHGSSNNGPQFFVLEWSDDGTNWNQVDATSATVEYSGITEDVVRTYALSTKEQAYEIDKRFDIPGMSGSGTFYVRARCTSSCRVAGTKMANPNAAYSCIPGTISITVE